MNAAPSHDDCQDNVLPSAPPPPEVPKKPSTAPATLPGRPAHSLVRQRGKIPDLGATTAHRRAAAGIQNRGSAGPPPYPPPPSALGWGSGSPRPRPHLPDFRHRQARPLPRILPNPTPPPPPPRAGPALP